MQFAAQHVALQTIGTLPALNAAGDIALLEPDEIDHLTEAWLLATRIRNAITLTGDKPSDSIPSDQQQLRLLAFALKFSNGSELVETYKRTARRARSVMQLHVYGIGQTEI